jgi:predicted small lipoprotein YifL
MQILERQWQSAASGGRAAAGPALLLAVAVCLLAGCGRAGPLAGGAASSPAAASADSGAGEEGAPTSDADLVSAVNAGGPAKPLDVKFRVEARPVIGMPVKILLALIPADQGEIDHIHASLTAGEGLQMQSPTTFDLSDLKGGTPQYQEVTVLPQQTGVLDLTATLLLQTDKMTESRTYSIPLIAADNSSNP